MTKYAIASMATGEDFQKLSEISFPTMRAYAHRIGADFYELPGGRFPGRHTHWEKLSVGRLLEAYVRVAWIDCDAIVNPRAPSLFDAVPEDHFGAFNEGAVINRTEEIAHAIELYGPGVHATRYFNAGVMVFSRLHTRVFDPPTEFPDGGMPEQTYVNAQVGRLGVWFYDLTSRWNGFSSYHGPRARAELNLIHYAGWPKNPGWVEAMTQEMKQDLARWEERT